MQDTWECQNLKIDAICLSNVRTTDEIREFKDNLDQKHKF
jgi:hypothetical protein